MNKIFLLIAVALSLASLHAGANDYSSYNKYTSSTTGSSSTTYNKYGTTSSGSSYGGYTKYPTGGYTKYPTGGYPKYPPPPVSP